MAKIPITPIERTRYPIITACMREGTLGRLILAQTHQNWHSVPIPNQLHTSYPLDTLSLNERGIIRGSAEGRSVRQLRQEDKVSQASKARRCEKLYAKVSATNRPHLIRRMVELGALPGLAQKPAPYPERTTMFPRCLLYVGAGSHGVTAPTIAAISGKGASTVSRDFQRYNGTCEILKTITNAFRGGWLRPDEHLPTDFVADGLAMMLHPDHHLIAPEELLPNGPFHSMSAANVKANV